MSGISLQVDFYMIQKDQVFVADVVVIDLTWEIVALSVINWLMDVAIELNAIAKIHKYKGFHEEHHFIQMAMEVHSALKHDMDHLSGNVFVFSMIDNWEVIYPCLFGFIFLGNMLVLLSNVL